MADLHGAACRGLRGLLRECRRRQHHTEECLKNHEPPAIREGTRERRSSWAWLHGISACERAARCGHLISERRRRSRRWATLLFTRQNELRPNHAKQSVNAIAKIKRPGPASRPAWYFAYSRNPVTAPMAAMARKVNPVTSSQSWCRTLPNEMAVAWTPLIRAAPVRVRAACWTAIRTISATFFAICAAIILSILAAARRTMVVARITRSCDDGRQRASGRRVFGKQGGLGGPTTQAVHEGTGRSNQWVSLRIRTDR